MGARLSQFLALPLLPYDASICFWPRDTSPTPSLQDESIFFGCCY